MIHSLYKAWLGSLQRCCENNARRCGDSTNRLPAIGATSSAPVAHDAIAVYRCGMHVSFCHRRAEWQPQSATEAFYLFQHRCPRHAESSPDFGCGATADEALLGRLEALCASSGGGSAEQRGMRASVNVQEACLLHVAVPHILTRLLQQYNAALPFRHWLLVCVNFARLIVTVRGFRNNPDAEAPSGAPPDAFKASLVATKLAVIQYTARAILNALRNPCSTVRPLSLSLSLLLLQEPASVRESHTASACPGQSSEKPSATLGVLGGCGVPSRDYALPLGLFR